MAKSPCLISQQVMAKSPCLISQQAMAKSPCLISASHGQVSLPHLSVSCGQVSLPHLSKLWPSLLASSQQAMAKYPCLISQQAMAKSPCLPSVHIPTAWKTSRKLMERSVGGLNAGPWLKGRHAGPTSQKKITRQKLLRSIKVDVSYHALCVMESNH